MNHDGHHSEQTSSLSRFLPKTGHGWMMAACCTLMVVAAVSILTSGSEGSVFGNSLWALLPLAGCLLMHSVMHKMMGHHGHHAEARAAIPHKEEAPSRRTSE